MKQGFSYGFPASRTMPAKSIAGICPAMQGMTKIRRTG